MASLDAEEFLTADEACALLGVKLATLYAYVSRGVLPSFREGMRRRRLYRRHDIEQLLTLRPSGARPASPPRAAGDAARSAPHAEDWIPYVN